MDIRTQTEKWYLRARRSNLILVTAAISEEADVAPLS